MRQLGIFVFCLWIPALAGCGNSTDELPSQPRFRLRPSTTPEPVRLEITSAAAVAEAEDLLQSGEGRWAVGAIRSGDGGFNAPWHWHLDPATVSFAEITIEACQATPPYIEQTLDYWIAFGQVCIGGIIEARER